MPAEPDGLSRRSFLKFAGAATASATLAGCTGGLGGGSGFNVGVTMGNMDSGLDPQDHAETNTDIVVSQGYEGLMDRDPEGGIVEGLATNWERVEDGTVTFTLREGVTFHNGDPLTPEDVRFSLRRIVFDDVGITSPQNTDLGAISEIQTGDGEVTVVFDGLNPIAFQLFATNGEIMQQSWVEGNSRDFINQNLNGTGPFTLESYDSGNEVVFSRNEEYWGGAAAVGGVTLTGAAESSTRVNQLLAEETDIVENVPPQEISRVQNSDVASIKAIPSTRIIFLQMRYDVEPFSSQEFRQALNYAVDVQSIIDEILNGFGAITGQPTLEMFTGYNPDVEPYTHDTAEAERLVEASGHAGVEITLQTPIGRYLADVEIAQAAAAQIDSLSNVSCSVEQRDFSALVQDLITGNIEDKPHFNLLGWGNGEFDASQTITPLLTSDAALTVLKNDQVDQFMADASSEADPQAREAILQEANAFLHDLAPWVYMHQQYSVYGVSNRIDWEPRADEMIDPYRAQPK